LFVERAFQTHRLLRDAAGALRLLEGAGIRTMALKGVHLASAIYPDPSMRGMADVDIMVDREHLAQADALFVAHGWGPEPRPNVDQFCEESNHLAKLAKPGSAVLEIHYHIERPTSPFRIPISGLWDTAREVEVQGVKTLGLAPEELVIHLCLHASYHHQFERAPLKALLDIRAVLERCGDGFDWPRLCRLATEWGAGRFVYSTLCVGDALLDLPFPPRVIGGLAPAQDAEALTDVASQFIRTEGVDFPEALIDVTASHRWTDRVRALARAIFLPPSKMRARYDLRPGSPVVFAYYLVRPFDMLVRQGRLVASLLLRTPRAQVALRRAQARRAIADWVRSAHHESL
jgi:hypothetical protein